MTDIAWPSNLSSVTGVIGERVMTRTTDDLMAAGAITSFIWSNSGLRLFSIPYASFDTPGEVACLDPLPSGPSRAMGEMAVMVRTSDGGLSTSGMSSFIWNNQEDLASFTACLRVASTWCDMPMRQR